MTRLLRYVPLLTLTCALGCGTPSGTLDTDGAVPRGRPAGLGGAVPGPVDENAPEEFTPTGTGLEYRIRRAGNGDRPSENNTVTVHYRGWLDDNSVFDSSYERGQPATFPLTGVIRGWTEGLQFVSEGGMIELRIPSELGYGAAGSPPNIPPGAQLHFLVELLHFE